MDGKQRQTLRAEATDAIRQVQRLPGFREASDRLPTVPVRAAQWKWWTVLAVGEGLPPGTIAWDERRLSAFSTQQGLEILIEIKRHGKIAERVRRKNGGLHARVPMYEAALDQVERDEATAYRRAVERFANAYLFGAQWSARALHDALRHRADVRLPVARPEGWVTPPVASPITLRQNDPVPRADLRMLGEALVERASSPPRDRRLGASREATWRRALEATQGRLQKSPISGTERSALFEARRYLNAAVNGELDSAPLEPSDDDGWLATRVAEIRNKRPMGAGQ